MKSRRFNPGWLNVFAVLLWLVAVAGILSVWHLTLRDQERSLQEISLGLDHNVRFLLPTIYRHILAGNQEALEDLCDLEESLGNFRRLTVVYPDGRVLADSGSFRHPADILGDRPEVVAAQASGQAASATRLSSANRLTLLYAVPLDIGGQRYVVRAAQDIDDFAQAVMRTRVNLMLISLASLVVVLVFTGYVGWKVVLPLRRLRQTAERIADGEMDAAIASASSGEVGRLATPLASLAEQLRNHYQERLQRKLERDVIFEALSEGIMLLAQDGRIRDCNREARRIFDWPEDAVGHLFRELEPDARIHEFTMRLPESGTGEIELIRDGAHGQQHLRLYGAMIDSGTVRVAGILLVVTDVTRLTRLEHARREFLGNLSHELRTPLTALQGAAETLLDGACLDSGEAARFLRIIERHTERLSMLVRSIIALSNLEEKALLPRDNFLDFDAGDVVYGAEEWAYTRLEPGQSLEVDIAEGELPIRGDLAYLEQAVCNYIDNAVKYAGPSARIILRLRRDRGDAVIEVEDDGKGIAPEHLEHIFDRFYRVDRTAARGAGLGLPIVRHIAQWHGGRAEVESRVGAGSIFRIRIPLRA